MEVEEYFLLRCKKHIKQRDVAKFLNVSPSLICKFERGNTTMSEYNINQYKKYIEEN